MKALITLRLTDNDPSSPAIKEDTGQKQKAILFTQANYLKMSWQQPTLIRI